MTTAIFDPKTTLVILLGASVWHPDRKNLAHSHPTEDNPFQRSVDGMRDYFLNFLKIPAGNLKDLFNFQDNADALLEQIEEFLKESGTNKTDLFIYYVGHGITLTGEFCFSIPSAKDKKFDLSAKKLWLTLGETVFHLRCYFILDACFSGEVTKLPTESGPKSALFFCSALGETLRIDRNEKGKNITVFTEALLKTLQGENPHLPVFPPQLSFNEIEVPLKQLLKESYSQTPEPHFSSTEVVPKNLKLFENYRLSKVKEEFSKHQGTILPIAKSVHSYLKSIGNKALTESNQSQLEQLTAFLTGKISAEEFVHFWQIHPVILELNYPELSEKLQQGRVVIFLGANVLKQDANLLTELAEKIEHHSDYWPLSQLCEYIEMDQDRDFLCGEVEKIPQTANSKGIYELLATLKEPLTIISTEYSMLLEETFKQQQKPFITLSMVNHWHDNSRKGKLLLKYSDDSDKVEIITEETLSDLNFEGYTLIYKIRGCFGVDKQHLILSESDYFNFAHSLEKSIPAYLINLIRTLGLLFIDYYPKRWEDRLITRMLLEQSNVEITAIHSEASEKFIEKYWKHKKVVIHPVKMSEFVEKLTAHLTELEHC